MISGTYGEYTAPVSKKLLPLKPTSIVYSQYVPLIMTPLVYDPSDFTPRKGVMTRYAKKMIRPEFYGKIHCKDLNLV